MQDLALRKSEDSDGKEDEKRCIGDGRTPPHVIPCCSSLLLAVVDRLNFWRQCQRAAVQCGGVYMVFPSVPGPKEAECNWDGRMCV